MKSKIAFLVIWSLLCSVITSPIINIVINAQEGDGGANTGQDLPMRPEREPPKPRDTGRGDKYKDDVPPRRPQGDDPVALRNRVYPNVTDRDDSNRVWMVAIGDNHGAQNYKTPQGYLAGFNNDIVEAVCEAAGIECMLVYEPYNSCVNPDYFAGEGLSGRWFDACTSWIKTVRRSLFFSFSKPYLKNLPTYFYTINGTDFDTTNLTNYNRIGFIESWSSDPECISRELAGVDGVPLIHDHIVFYNTPQEIHAAVLNGEINAAFMQTLHGNTFKDLQRNGQPFECALSGPSMMARKDSKFLEHFNRGLDIIMKNGKYQKICQRAREIHESPSRMFFGCLDQTIVHDEN